MTDSVYKIEEIVGSSPKGQDAAIENAIERATRTLRNLRWFEVVESRGHIEDGKIGHYQVRLKVAFTLD